MVIKCQRCGAPLEVAETATIATCRFCKATSHVHKQQAAPARPPGGVGCPQPGHVPGATARKANVAIALVGTLVMVGVGGGVAATQFLSAGGGAGSLTGLGSVGGPGAWSASSPGCMIDANGDGVFDIMGMSGRPGETYEPTIVDGAKGSVIWSGSSLGKGANIACIDTEWTVGATADFELQFFNARKPDPPIRVRASDKLYGAAAGKGCAAIKTSDQKTIGVKLPGGTTAPCPVSEIEHMSRNRPGVIGLTGKETHLYLGKKQYSLTKRRTGTPMLSLRVQDDGKTVYDKELPYAAATFGSGIAVGGDHIVVFGARAGDRKKGMLIGLDEKTGNELWQVVLPGMVTHGPGLMTHNGRWVVVSYWVGLRAFDPKDGREVWHVGG